MGELYRAASDPTSGIWRRHGWSAGDFVPDPSNRRVNIGPCRLVRGKLPPQIRGQFGDLAVGKTVFKGGHIAEVGRDRRRNAVENDLDQVVRMGAVKVAVQRQRRTAAEQRRAADLVAYRAGALVEPGASARHR